MKPKILFLKSEFTRKRYSIDQNMFDFSCQNENSLESQPNQPTTISKKDLFLFKRKNTEQKEYFNAKSVVNLELEGEESEEGNETQNKT